MAVNLYVRRVMIAVCSVFLVSIMLIIRLYTLFFVDNESLEVLSGQYTRKNTVVKREGFVYDTKGELLSHRSEGVVVIVKPDMKKDRNEIVGYLSDFSGYDFDEILEKYNKNVPFTLKFDTVPEKSPPDGVYLYPSYELAENSLCRHILGFYNSDGKGMDGVFKRFEDVIDGCSGNLSYKYTANAMGALLDDGLFYIEDRGYTGQGGVMLTINAELQREVDRICDEKLDMGAVIISDLSDGGILALSSRPLYDRDNVAECLESDRGELINRAFSLYTPGSVFKAVCAAAALEKDEKFYDLEYECTGSSDVSGKLFKCHKTDGHGVQNMKQAFANSCNTYFINLVKEAGFEYVLTFCNRMGLGESHSIDGFFTDGACIPDITKKYPDAYKANFSFGQGELMLSCIDVLDIYSACATGFKRDFSLLKGECDDDGKPSEVFIPKTERRILTEETSAKMREMMKECVVNGTGKAAWTDRVSVGGKTATAQSGQYRENEEVLHKWFAGVFPIDEPRYAVVVLCDGNGMSNGDPRVIFSECAKQVVRICNN